MATSDNNSTDRKNRMIVAKFSTWSKSSTNLFQTLGKDLFSPKSMSFSAIQPVEGCLPLYISCWSDRDFMMLLCLPFSNGQHRGLKNVWKMLNFFISC